MAIARKNLGAVGTDEEIQPERGPPFRVVESPRAKQTKQAEPRSRFRLNGPLVQAVEASLVDLGKKLLDDGKPAVYLSDDGKYVITEYPESDGRPMERTPVNREKPYDIQDR